MTRLTREQLRQRYGELRELVNGWDPIGVMGDPDWPRDEYDCLVGPLLRRLEAAASVPELGDFLHAELAGHFGLDAPRGQCRVWAGEAAAWYAARWAASEAAPRADA